MKLTADQFIAFIDSALQHGVVSSAEVPRLCKMLRERAEEETEAVEEEGDGCALMSEAYTAIARAMEHPSNSIIYKKSAPKEPPVCMCGRSDCIEEDDEGGRCTWCGHSWPWQPKKGK